MSGELTESIQDLFTRGDDNKGKPAKDQLNLILPRDVSRGMKDLGFSLLEISLFDNDRDMYALSHSNQRRSVLRL